MCIRDRCIQGCIVHTRGGAVIGFPKFNSGFLASLLPEEVFSSEYLGSFYGFPLIGKEKEISRSFSSKRLKEFSVGRKCARNALSHLGFNDPPILIGTNREPIWPKNICGSITHCRGSVSYTHLDVYKRQWEDYQKSVSWRIGGGANDAA